MWGNNQCAVGITSLIFEEVFNDCWRLAFHDHYIKESANKFAAYKSQEFFDYPNVENTRNHDDDSFTEILDDEPVPIFKDNFVPISALIDDRNKSIGKLSEASRISKVSTFKKLNLSKRNVSQLSHQS